LKIQNPSFWTLFTPFIFSDRALEYKRDKERLSMQDKKIRISIKSDLFISRKKM